MPTPVYLDNNATTPTAPEVLDAMRHALEVFGDPSSTHVEVKYAREIEASARGSVAKLIGADTSEIAFTSGGAESNTWAIRGVLESQPAKDHIVTTRVEHESVRKLCEKLERDGTQISWIDVDPKGRLDLDQLRDSLRPETAVVSVMMANNETGVVFPIEDVSKIVKERSDALFHVDAVAAVGKMPIRVEKMGIDLMSLSAHKFHGPKGIGALYIRESVSLPPIQLSESWRTDNEAIRQIAGLGAAAEFAEDLSPMDEIRRLRDKLEASILEKVDIASVNGGIDSRLPNTSNISFENLNGEMILHYLDEAGIRVATGSACNSESKVSSPILAAMDVPYSRSMGSIRFSLGRTNTETDIDQTISALESVIRRLASMSSV